MTANGSPSGFAPMAAERLVLPAGLQSDELQRDFLCLGGETAHHLLRVLRLKRGEPLLVGDGCGATRAGRVARAQAEEFRVEWTGGLRRAPRPVPEIVLVLGVPDGKDLSRALVNATEAGVDRLVLIRAARSVRPLPATGGKTWERLVRAIREACAQAGRPHVPAIESADGLASAVRGAAWLRTCAPAPSREARGSSTPPQEADGPWIAVVGPEGGLSPDESSLLAGLGATPLWLGPTVLRTRTATAIAVHDLVMLRSSPARAPALSPAPAPSLSPAPEPDPSR
jgi:16S rRNA (uracil1498-N3)-methyltransferase